MTDPEMEVSDMIRNDANRLLVIAVLAVALEIAGNLCIYSNTQIIVEELACQK